jgi:nucleoside-diphosphate-sugar epimerase
MDHPMSQLVCFGYGYSANYFVGMFGTKFDRIVGTVREVDRAAAVNAESANLRGIVFDGKTITSEIDKAIAEADCLLISVPPDENGDAVVRVLGEQIAGAKNLKSIVYLSTIGVYGDSDGGWVDENTPPKPGAARSQERLTAEQSWQALGEQRRIPVAILRLAGIYGPGQNALTQIASGRARRIVKPGQVFNRIHVGDIAQAIDSAFTRRACGIFNIADDEPTPAGEPIAFAAQLMGVAPPLEIAFDNAAQAMSPMALSFWQECRRVHNDKLKSELGVSLLYPTYREGLRVLHADTASG